MGSTVAKLPPQTVPLLGAPSKPPPEFFEELSSRCADFALLVPACRAGLLHRATVLTRGSATIPLPNRGQLSSCAGPSAQTPRAAIMGNYPRVPVLSGVLMLGPCVCPGSARLPGTPIWRGEW